MRTPAPPLERLVGFVGFTRANGFNTGIGEVLDALAVASEGNVMGGRRLRWELKSLLCSRRREWERFDELFDAWFKPPNRFRVASSPHAPRQAPGKARV